MLMIRSFYDPLNLKFVNDDIRAEIGSGMMVMGITQRELADRAGIERSTLSRRIGKNGNIASMTLGELTAIRNVFKKGGVVNGISV